MLYNPTMLLFCWSKYSDRTYISTKIEKRKFIVGSRDDTTNGQMSCWKLSYFNFMKVEFSIWESVFINYEYLFSYSIFKNLPLFDILLWFNFEECTIL